MAVGESYDKGGAVYNAANPEFSIDISGMLPATKRISDLANEVSSAGGGVVFFGSGRYRICTEKEQEYAFPGKVKLVHTVTIPTGVTAAFGNGAVLEIDNDVTIRFAGPLKAGPHRIFDVLPAKPGHQPGKVVIERGAVKEIIPQWWGALGNGKDDDGPAIQAALDATPKLDAAASNGGVLSKAPSGEEIIASVVLPPVQTRYQISAPLVIRNSMLRLAGQSAGVHIQSAEDVIHVQGTGISRLFGVIVEDLVVVGPLNSTAIDASRCIGLEVKDVDTVSPIGGDVDVIKHLGPGMVLHDCAKTRVVNCRFQPEGKYDGASIVDIDGIGSSYENVKISAGGTGIHLVRTADASIESSQFEWINKGLKRAIWADSSGDLAKPVAPFCHGKLHIKVRGCYFENPTGVATDFVPTCTIFADPGYWVLMEDCNSGGGYRAKDPENPAGKLAVATETVDLDGGGRVIGLQGGAGTRISSKSGIVDVERSANVYGNAREVRFSGATPPFPPGTENLAPNSWFDELTTYSGANTRGLQVVEEKDMKVDCTETFMEVGGFEPDKGMGFLGPASVRISLDKFNTINLKEPSDYLVGVRSADLSISRQLDGGKNENYYSIVALKASRAGERFFIRSSYSSNNPETSFITSGEWQVIVHADQPWVVKFDNYFDKLVDKPNGPKTKVNAVDDFGHTSIGFDVSSATADLESFKVWLGGVAVARSSRVGLIRTENTLFTKLENGELEFPVLKTALVSKIEAPIWEGGGKVFFTKLSVDGCEPGDRVVAGLDSPFPKGLIVSAMVQEKGQVMVTLLNETGKGLDLEGREIRVAVSSRMAQQA